MAADKRWFRAQSIGSVVRTDADSGDNWVDPANESVIRIEPRWQEDLVGLEGFSHLVVLAWLDRAQRLRKGGKIVSPEDRPDLAQVGFFSIRTPRRPNPIGISCPRLLRINGPDLHVRGLDFWNGTPIIDIKGYFPRDEQRPDATVPDWLESLWQSHDAAGPENQPAPRVFDEIKTPRGVVTFREAGPGDAAAAMRYINALSNEHTYVLLQGEQMTLAQEAAWLRDRLDKMREKKCVQVFVSSGDEIIGSGVIERNGLVSAHTASLGVSISADWRGLGLGRRLMEIMIEQATITFSGLRLIRLEVFATNAPAIALYESLNFQHTGRIPGALMHGGQPVDELTMALTLA